MVHPVLTVRVVVPLFMPKALDYAWPHAKPPEVFQLVQVPVGRNIYHGMVVDVAPKTKPGAKKFKLKNAEPLAMAPFAAATGKFYQWVSQYNFTYPGEGLRAALQSGKAPSVPAPGSEIYLCAPDGPFKTPAQKKVHAAFKEQSAFTTQADLARVANVSVGVVKGLLEKNILSTREQRAPEKPLVFKNNQNIKLGADQAHAAQEICAAVAHKSFTPFLLDGVTGSGKTEVYFEVISTFLSQNQQGQILILLPEIALTPQWLSRFEARFGVKPALWHSGVSQRQRQRAWWGVFSGAAQVVVGARSALFLPFKALNLVVVDEEHDGSYKQEEGFRYSGRDMAIVRAKLFSCPVVLASATPSLESWHNVQQGRYKHLVLSSRYGAAHLPEISLIDLTKQKPPRADQFISVPLAKKLAQNLAKGQQSMLFLNRRGYAPLLICQGCGHRVVCPSCSAHLVVHGQFMQCHHCGFTEPMPNTCTQCKKEETLHPFGPGTRKILAEVQQLLPQARCSVVDRDSIQTPQQMEEVVRKMANQDIDILVGTQMLAKGHDFAHLTLVGVLDADMSLSHGDLRAMERTFQLLTQVAGRAGRRAEKGQVFLQTHTVGHPLFQALKTMDRDAFLNMELKSRQESGFPPFGRLTALIVSSPDEQTALNFSQQLAQTWPEAPKAKLFGPAPAPLLKLRDQYRYRLLLQTGAAPHGALQTWLAAQRLPKGVRLDVDIDPQSFF